MAMTAFAACRIVGGFESRSPTGSIVTVATFNSRQMNWISLFEVVLLILVVAFDLFNRLLGTASLTSTQWGLALAPAGALLLLWELGKLIARRSKGGAPEAAAALPSAAQADQKPAV
jgi:Ca2+-transporting ATPase